MSSKSRPVESDIEPGSRVRPTARARSLGKLRTIPETAEILQTSERTVQRLIASGQLRAHRLRRLVRGVPTWNTGHPVTLRIVTYQDEPNTNRRTAVPLCSRKRTFFAPMISCFAPSIGCLFQFAKRSMLTNSHLVVAALLQVSLLGPASAGDKKPDECGLASVYATVTEETASGEDTQPENFTAAHRTLPFGTLVDVDNQENGHWAVVRITDRGPFVSGRIIDLSQAAARALGISGLTQVCLNITRMPERQSVGQK